VSEFRCGAVEVAARDQQIGAERATHGRDRARRLSAFRGAVPGEGAGHREYRVVICHVGRLDPEHEPHRLQEGQQGPGRARLDVRPQRVPVVGEGQVVLDVPLGAEDQRLGGLPGLEVPVIRTTPRCERSTIAVPAASARCSA
jgi:hypothetical protein